MSVRPLERPFRVGLVELETIVQCSCEVKEMNLDPIFCAGLMLWFMKLKRKIQRWKDGSGESKTSALVYLLVFLPLSAWNFSCGQLQLPLPYD